MQLDREDKKNTEVILTVQGRKIARLVQDQLNESALKLSQSAELGNLARLYSAHLHS